MKPNNLVQTNFSLNFTYMVMVVKVLMTAQHTKSIHDQVITLPLPSYINEIYKFYCSLISSLGNAVASEILSTSFK